YITISALLADRSPAVASITAVDLRSSAFLLPPTFLACPFPHRLLDRLFQLSKIHRLREMRREAGFHALFQIAVHPEAADCDPAHCPHLAQPAHQFRARPIWQTDIADHQIERLLPGRF